VDYVPEPHIFDDQELCARADGRFGLVDCFQWPQKYDRDYSFTICIPRKDSILSHEIAWYTPTADDFIIPAGSKFAVGTLREAKVKAFEQLLQLLRNRHHHLPSQSSGQHILRYRVRVAQHEVVRLRRHPLVFQDLVIFIAQLQRTLLDIHAMLDYFEIVRPLLENPPSKPVHANPTWMGCFTSDTQICDELYMAGVPVWLFRNEHFISPTMNIVNPVRFTFPDHIVKAPYSENGAAKPFQCLYRGPAGVLRHFHTRRPYQGTLDQAPEPVAALSAAHASSSQPSSRGGKQPTQKQSRAARERASAGPCRGM